MKWAVTQTCLCQNGHLGSKLKEENISVIWITLSSLCSLVYVWQNHTHTILNLPLDDSIRTFYAAEILQKCLTLILLWNVTWKTLESVLTVIIMLLWRNCSETWRVEDPNAVFIERAIHNQSPKQAKGQNSPNITGHRKNQETK